MTGTEDTTEDTTAPRDLIDRRSSWACPAAWRAPPRARQLWQALFPTLSAHPTQVPSGHMRRHITLSDRCHLSLSLSDQTPSPHSSSKDARARGSSASPGQQLTWTACTHAPAAGQKPPPPKPSRNPRQRRQPLLQNTGNPAPISHARARAARGHLEERTGGIGLWRRPAA